MTRQSHTHPDAPVFAFCPALRYPEHAAADQDRLRRFLMAIQTLPCAHEQ